MGHDNETPHTTSVEGGGIGAGRDSIHTGAAGAGSVAGSGSVEAETIAGRDVFPVNVTVNVADLDRQMADLSAELKARTQDDDYARILNEQFMIVWGGVAEALKQNVAIQRDLQNLERTVGRMVDAVYGNGSVGLLRTVDRAWRAVWTLAGSSVMQWLVLIGAVLFVLALARFVGF